VVGILLLGQVAPLAIAGEPQVGPSPFVRTVEANMRAVVATIDINSIVGVAATDKSFTTLAGSQYMVLNALVYGWSFDSLGNVTLTSVTVWYSSSDSTFSIATGVSPLTLQVAGSARVPNRYFSGVYYSFNSAGYVVGPIPPAGLQPMYEAYSSFTVPTVTAPANGCPYGCDFAIWTGLTGKWDGSTGIAQIILDASVSASTSYAGYVQFYPAPAVNCNTFSQFATTHGDSIIQDVVNTAIDGGDGAHYDMMMMDTTTNTACSVTNQTWPQGSNGFTTPYYANFIGERCCGLRLGKYSTVSITASYSDSTGTPHGIYTLYSGSHYVKVIMQNQGITNIAPSTVSSSSVFSLPWSSSGGT